MLKARFVVLLMFGTLMSAACFADETVAESADGVVYETQTISATTPYPEHWLKQVEDFEFQDNSPLGRVKRMRDLPLLTFSDTGSTRFFLGVNRDGVVGLHFTSK